MSAASKAKSQAATVDVLDHFHRDVHRQLDELMGLVSRLDTLAVSEELRGKARELVAFFSGPVREHNYDEERHVFPALRLSSEPELRQAAETLCEDHAWIELGWLDVEAELASVGRRGSVKDLPALRAGADAFAGLMRDHMALEECLLYPHLRGSGASATLTPSNQERVAPRAVRPRR